MDDVSRWSDASRHNLVFFDLVKSFGPSSSPPAERRIISGRDREKLWLSNSTWQAGNEAVCYLLQSMTGSMEGADRALTVMDLSTAYPEMHLQLEGLLDELFFPDMVRRLESQMFDTGYSVDEFQSLWSKYGFASKAIVFLDFVAAAPREVEEALDDLPQKLSALAILETIDECVLSSMSGGGRLEEYAIDVERLRSQLLRHRMPLRDLEYWKRLAMSERGAELAKRSHKKSNDAKDWVLSEWALHASEYRNIKSDFARVYSRLILDKFGATVKGRQIREVWLKGYPSASRPAGMPADGE